MSTSEVYYMIIAKAYKMALQLTRLVKELSVDQGRVQLHCASESSIYLINNQVYYAMTSSREVSKYQRLTCIWTNSTCQNSYFSNIAIDMLTKSSINQDQVQEFLGMFICFSMLSRTYTSSRQDAKAMQIVGYDLQFTNKQINCSSRERNNKMFSKKKINYKKKHHSSIFFFLNKSQFYLKLRSNS